MIHLDLWQVNQTSPAVNLDFGATAEGQYEYEYSVDAHSLSRCDVVFTAHYQFDVDALSLCSGGISLGMFAEIGIDAISISYADIPLRIADAAVISAASVCSGNIAFQQHQTYLVDGKSLSSVAGYIRVSLPPLAETDKHDGTTPGGWLKLDMQIIRQPSKASSLDLDFVPLSAGVAYRGRVAMAVIDC